VCGPSPTTKRGKTAVFLDPPYAKNIRTAGCYSTDTDPAQYCAEWAFRAGDDPMMRIALCGYDGEHAPPNGWTVYEWKAHGGYANETSGKSRGKENKAKERILFSPHCLAGSQGELF